MENPHSIIANDIRRYRAALLADPYRPAWHFAIPDDYGMPFDPNGAFWADGRYHLMYLYRNTALNAYHWGHISSIDLLHWRHHHDALTGVDGDEGCFSGGAFVDDDGTVYLTFWKFPSKNGEDNGGIAMARSVPPYDIWERVEPITLEETEWGILETEKDGQPLHLGCADPSNIWKYNDTYFMQTGNKCVLDKYGRKDGADPAFWGDWTDLFSSKDLIHWTYLRRFYANPHLDADYPDKTEDDMCPQFLPLPDAPRGGKLTDSYFQLFISHNHGAQYYIGHLDETRTLYIPEQHGRFSWRDNACFAPEALIDGQNRLIAWYWLLDNPADDFNRFGWSGVYNFPRVLWLEENVLHMAPADELAALQTHRQSLAPLTASDAPVSVPVSNGESFRLRAVIDAGSADKIGFSVRSDGQEHTDIYYDSASKQLVMDAEHSGCDGWRIKEAAPFELKEGEPLRLDILVDHAVIEVYANERQAIARRVYPTHPAEAVGVSTFVRGGTAHFASVDTWEIEPTNPY